jgi:hypothetical protein
LDAPVIAERVADHDDELEEALEDDGRRDGHQQGEEDLRRFSDRLPDDHVGDKHAFFDRQKEQLLGTAYAWTKEQNHTCMIYIYK